VVTPAKVGGVVAVSRELADDSSPEASAEVGRGLVRKITRSIDNAYFGTLAAPAPAGLPSVVGVGTVDAGTAWTSLDWAAQAITQAEEVGATITSFVAHPDDGLILAQLKDQTGSLRPLLGIDATVPTRRVVLGVPLLVSPSVTVGTVWGIPGARIVAVVRDDARVEVDRSYYFLSDRVAVRGTMRVGFAFPHPAAVQKITIGP